MGHALSAVAGQEQADTPAAAEKQAIEELTRDFLESQGVTAFQIAIARNGSLILTEAYAGTPPAGFQPVDQKTLFRVSGCTCMFTCAAISALHAQGKLDLDAKVFPMLGINAPAIHKDKPDPHIDAITVKHLVDHAGGWNDHENLIAKDGTHVPGAEWDPMFSVRKIALDMKLDRPPSRLEIARYMYGKPLQFAPGSQDFRSTLKRSYSNFGYMLLGLVIEKVTGQTYVDFVRTGLGPSKMDMTNVYLSRLLDGTVNPREVWYVTSNSQPTALKPLSNEIVSSAYGGGFIPELLDSAGGLMTNAETLVQFASSNAVWGMGDRAPRHDRKGNLNGTSSAIYSRANGIDVAFVMNTREFDGGPQRLDNFTAALVAVVDRL